MVSRRKSRKGSFVGRTRSLVSNCRPVLDLSYLVELMAKLEERYLPQQKCIIFVSHSKILKKVVSVALDKSIIICIYLFGVSGSKFERF